MKKILLLLPLIFAASCKSTSTPAPVATASPVAPKNITIVIQGLTKLGSVAVGDYRETEILITNNTVATAPIQPLVTVPFFIYSATSPCDVGVLPSGKSCQLRIRFAPTASGSFSTTFQLGNNTVQLTGVGLQGGDIQLSQSFLDLAQLSAGIENDQTLTLTNVGDFTVPFPTFAFPTGISLLSNECGASLASKQTCQIQLAITKTMIGSQSDTVTMTSTSPGSGTNTSSLSIVSFVVPGEASGNITFQTTVPAFNIDNNQSVLLTTNPIMDQFGNIISDGTIVSVSVQNMILTESPQFHTVGGQISFHVAPTSVKGAASISITTGTAFGNIPLYVRAGLPFGLLTLQPYNPTLTADGATQLLLRFNPITDRFGNNVEDSTQLTLQVAGAGGGIISPQIVSTFQGSAQFVLTSGIISGNISVQARANPILDSNNNIVDYGAKGDFPLIYVPGPPSGTIPITPALRGMNSSTDTNLITIGPVLDKEGNVVVFGTPIVLTITNGINANVESNLFTDINGNSTFVLRGSGNRGPIIVQAISGLASGSLQVWGYKNSHLTLQGQARDDWGTGAGNNNINSGRAYTKYAKSNTTTLPPLDKGWDEVYNYSELTQTDHVYYSIEHLNGLPITTLGTQPGNLFPDNVPSDGSIVSYPQAPIVPYWESSTFYSAGTSLMNAPYWSSTNPSPATPLFGCSESDADILGTYLYNMILFDSNNGSYSCKSGANVITSDSSSDRSRNDVRSGLLWPMIGYVEDPIGCSFDSSQAPNFSFNLGEYVRGVGNTRTIILFNPNPLPVSALSYQLPTGTDPNWILTNSNCTPVLASQASCSLTLSYLTNSITIPAQYSTTININSSEVAINISIQVKIDAFAPSQLAATGLVGTVPLQTNCYTKLATFGGYNYIENSNNKVVASTSTLLSLFNLRGQLITHFDNNCGSFASQASCQGGNGCTWTFSTDPNVQSSCDNSLDLGTYPTRGKALSPMIAVQRKLYNFSGFDPSGDGQVSFDELSVYDTEQGSWSTLSPEPDPLVTIQAQATPFPRYEHSLVYVADTTSLYLFGGIAVDPTNINNSILLDDLWQLNLFPPSTVDPDSGAAVPGVLTWKQICSSCGLPKPYSKITRNDTVAGPGYITPPAQAYMIWNTEIHKMFIYWLGRPEVYTFDPLLATPVFSAVDPTSGASALANSFQVVYNPKLGRTFSYSRGNPTGNPAISPSIESWDMDANHKTFFRTRFNVGAGSKPFASVLTPRVQAYASVGGDNTCSNPCPGATVYIYNYDLSQWDLVGANSALTDSQLSQQGEIGTSYNDADAQAHISTDGYVDILVSSNGNPLQYNKLFIDSVYLDGSF